MAAEENRTALSGEGPALPIDDEIEAALDAGDIEGFQIAAGLAQETLSEAEEMRILFGMGRAVRRLNRDIGTLIEQREAIINEYNEAMQRLTVRLRFLDSTLDQVVLMRREAGRGNFLDVPGVGRWSSQRTQPGWTLPTRKAEVEALFQWMKRADPDAYPTIVKDVPTLDTTALRKWLDEAREDGVTPDGLPPGVQFREPGVSVTYELRGDA